jgi:hypothetical protein
MESSGSAVQKPVILSGEGNMAESKDLQYPQVLVRSRETYFTVL